MACARPDLTLRPCVFAQASSAAGRNERAWRKSLIAVADRVSQTERRTLAGPARRSLAQQISRRRNEVAVVAMRRTPPSLARAVVANWRPRGRALRFARRRSAREAHSMTRSRAYLAFPSRPQAREPVRSIEGQRGHSAATAPSDRRLFEIGCATESNCCGVCVCVCANATAN